MPIVPKIPLDKLGPIAEGLITSGSKASQHRDYDRTVYLTEKIYHPLATGENQAHLYKRFNRRETPEDLKEVMEITQQVTPAWWNALATPARKVPGVKPVVNVLTFDKDDTGRMGDELQDELSRFTGDKSIDQYFASKLTDEGLTDPNAFVLMTFENFDNRYEKADVYSQVIPSRDVWNFEYKGGDLQWMYVHNAIQYVFTPGSADGQTKPIYQAGHRWILYGPNEHIVFEQVRIQEAPWLQVLNRVMDISGKPIEWASANTTGEVAYYIKIDDLTLYAVRIYAQKSRRVPAFRLGYIADQVTSGRTCVSLLHPAIPYFLKSIKAVRELDLTFALHAFPKRIEYRPTCPADSCRGGFDASGAKCSTCGGTGYVNTVTTTADHITLPLPARKDDMLEIAKLTHYDFPPSDGLKLMMENVAELRVSSMRAVYNSDVFVRDQVEQTATAKMVDMQSVYDALQPLAMWLASSRTTAVYVFAAYKSLDQMGGLTVHFAYPRHFKFESVADLMAMLKATEGAPISQGTILQLNMDLADQVFIDDPRSAQRAKTMIKWDPFAGRDEATVASLIAQGGKTTKRNEVLWTNMAYVFDMAEERTMSMTPPADFYAMTRPKQREVIDKIVLELIEDIDERSVSAAPEPIKLGTTLSEDESRSGADTGADGQNDQDIEQVA